MCSQSTQAVGRSLCKSVVLGKFRLPEGCCWGACCGLVQGLSSPPSRQSNGASQKREQEAARLLPAPGGQPAASSRSPAAGYRSAGLRSLMIFITSSASYFSSSVCQACVAGSPHKPAWSAAAGVITHWLLLGSRACSFRLPLDRNSACHAPFTRSHLKPETQTHSAQGHAPTLAACQPRSCSLTLWVAQQAHPVL